MDKLAQSSVVFEQCYSAASWTKPGVASLFTGTRPPVRQMVTGVWCEEPLPILHPGLAGMDEAFAAGGYQTAWFYRNPHCRQEFGLGRGFEQVRYETGEGRERQMEALGYL